MELPSADQIFLSYFAPWYPPDANREYTGVRPDLEEVVLPEGVHINVLNPLTPEGVAAAKKQIAQMRAAATTDWKNLLGVAGEPSMDWIKAFDDYCTVENVARLIEQSDPKNFANSFVVIACEAGAVIGEVLLNVQPGLQWLHDWPYWDSSIFDLNTKARINVFHWAFKKFSAEGREDLLVDKINASLQFIRTPPEAGTS